MAKKAVTRYSDSLSDLATSYLMCREKGHSWKHITDKILVTYRNEPREISRDWVCERCTTGMLEVLHVPSFDIVSRKYFYAEAYLLSKKATDGQRVDIRDIRCERLIRSGVIKSGRVPKNSRLRVVS